MALAPIGALRAGTHIHDTAALLLLLTSALAWPAFAQMPKRPWALMSDPSFGLSCETPELAPTRPYII